MIAPIKNDLITTLDTEIGYFEYYPKYVIGVMKEGVHVTFENSSEPLQLGAEIYENSTGFVYISHRINSYSTDPSRYKESFELFKNCKGVAIVNKHKKNILLGLIEGIFTKLPLRTFNTIEQAIDWSNKLIKERAN